MKISINVKLYASNDYVNGDVAKSFVRPLVADVTKFEEVPLVGGCAFAVLQVVRPISQMLRTICSSSQFLAVIETLSFTVRESLVHSDNWFHSTVYDDFEVVVETKLTE